MVLTGSNPQSASLRLLLEKLQTFNGSLMIFFFFLLPKGECSLIDAGTFFKWFGAGHLTSYPRDAVAGLG